MLVSGSVRKPLRRIWEFRLVKFAGGGLLNLFNRLLLVFIFASVGMPLALNYAMVHLFTLGFAFFYHSKITFRTRPSLAGFRRFVGSVILIRIFDYGFVLVATESVQVLELVSSLPYVGDFLGRRLLYLNVLIASALTFTIRYVVFTRFTFRERIESDKVGTSSD